MTSADSRWECGIDRSVCRESSHISIANEVDIASSALVILKGSTICDRDLLIVTGGDVQL
eukprot:14775655-Ditylum_brightwellii.AAC.1